MLERLSLLVAFMILTAGVLYNIDSNFRQPIKYDCRIAEISPDYPDKVKELCRKRNTNI